MDLAGVPEAFACFKRLLLGKQSRNPSAAGKGAYNDLAFLGGGGSPEKNHVRKAPVVDCDAASVTM